MSSRYCVYEGAFYPDEDIEFLSSSGGSFGDGLFESMRMLDGKIPFLQDHIQRLKEGMNVLQLKIPERYRPEYFQQQIEELCLKNEIGNNARLRLMVFRQSERGLPPGHQKPAYILEGRPLSGNQFALNQDGLRIGVYNEQAKPICTLSNYKTNNYLVSVLASIYGEQHQLDECLLMNDRGRIIEGIASNLFVRYGEKLFTPPVEQGCVDGVMRKQIFKLSPLPIHAKTFTPHDLLQADEIFLTNAVRGLQWVNTFQKRVYPNSFAKTLSEELNNRFV